MSTDVAQLYRSLTQGCGACCGKALHMSSARQPAVGSEWFWAMQLLFVYRRRFILRGPVELEYPLDANCRRQILQLLVLATWLLNVLLKGFSNHPPTVWFSLKQMFQTVELHRLTEELTPWMT
jgi:hypothetical protein